LPEAIELAKVRTSRFPNNPDLYFVRARIESFQQNNPEPLRAALRDHGELLDPVGRKRIDAEIATAEGRYLDAARLWEDLPVVDVLAQSAHLGFLYFAAGDRIRAEQKFRDAERYALGVLPREPARIDLKDLALAQSMLGKHAEALATIEKARQRAPEARDAANGASTSFVRSVVLVRAGRPEEGYAEVTRLLRVPFGVPLNFFEEPPAVLLLLKDDPHYNEIINHPPRL
jgi:tetratricopeptide (TPR) repeat protein